MLCQPFDLLPNTAIGGRVILMLVTISQELLLRFRMSVLQPALPHHSLPRRYTIASGVPSPSRSLNAAINRVVLFLSNACRKGLKESCNAAEEASCLVCSGELHADVISSKGIRVAAAKRTVEVCSMCPRITRSIPSIVRYPFHSCFLLSRHLLYWDYHLCYLCRSYRRQPSPGLVYLRSGLDDLY